MESCTLPRCYLPGPALDRVLSLSHRTPWWPGWLWEAAGFTSSCHGLGLGAPGVAPGLVRAGTEPTVPSRRFAMFHKVRIPRENLLNRVGDVTPEGAYVTRFKVGQPVLRGLLLSTPRETSPPAGLGCTSAAPSQQGNLGAAA